MNSFSPQLNLWKDAGINELVCVMLEGGTGARVKTPILQMRELRHKEVKSLLVVAVLNYYSVS